MDENNLTERQKRCIPDVTFELIPIRNLVSNQEYQRPLSEGHIRKTVEEFDIYEVNPVKISRRNGVNYIIDGQHTVEIIASESGSRSTPVWCMVFEMEYVDEARTFANQQKHVKSLVPYEIFKAHIEAGDQKQMMIKSIVESYGLKVTSTQQMNGVCAISTLEKIYDKYGQSVMDGALRLAVGTWEGEMNSLSGNMLMAIARILVAYGDSLKEDIFRDHLGVVSVKSIIRTAKERRPGALGFAEAMMIQYNLRNKRRLSLRTLYGAKGGTFEEGEDSEDAEENIGDNEDVQEENDVAENIEQED